MLKYGGLTLKGEAKIFPLDVYNFSKWMMGEKSFTKSTKRKINVTTYINPQKKSIVSILQNLSFTMHELLKQKMANKENRLETKTLKWTAGPHILMRLGFWWHIHS